jgi:hypothetical protein
VTASSWPSSVLGPLTCLAPRQQIMSTRSPKAHLILLFLALIYNVAAVAAGSSDVQPAAIAGSRKLHAAGVWGWGREHVCQPLQGPSCLYELPTLADEQQQCQVCHCAALGDPVARLANSAILLWQNCTHPTHPACTSVCCFSWLLTPHRTPECSRRCPIKAARQPVTWQRRTSTPPLCSSLSRSR